MAVVFFIYGLAFFSLGLVVALYPKKGSSFRLADKLWLIAAFGLVHGVNEWVDMFILLSGPEELLHVLNIIRTTLLVISFLCLLFFGTRSITRDGEIYNMLKAVPAVLLFAWAATVVTSGERFIMADIWGRYLLGAPGIFMTSLALILHEAELNEAGLFKARGFLRLSSGAFFFYGVFSGLVVPDAEFFPASVFNYSLFLETFGIPVQVLRTACAVILTYGFVHIMGIFEWETKDRLIKASDELESRVKERTAELIEINEELESEIAERRKAEDSLRLSKTNIETILESTPYGIVIVGYNKVIRYANNTALKIMGYDSMGQITGRICHQSMCPAATGKCPIIDLKQTVDKSERILITSNGTQVPILKSATTITLDGEKQILEAFIDISERRRAEEERAKLEEQLLHAQKMEAIGTLTGGISHDFNNILTAVIGYGEFLKDEMDEADPRMSYVDMIIASGEKGARLTQSLLAFSRKQLIHPKPVDLNNVVRSAEGLLSRLIGEDIELIITYPDKQLVVRADSVRMEQILMNLVTNSRDAMPDGGTLAICTEEVKLDNDFIRAHGFGKQGKYALVTVSDTGVGMDEKIKELIFEPFFTTKDVGKGTGLGLSVVYGLIKQHNGFMNVYSEPGMGTTFKIYLPMVEDKVEEVVSEPSIVKGGTETVLVAEDDDSVRGLIKKLLEKSGYSVMESSNGQEAVKLFDQNKDKIQLLVFDMVMPFKSGIDAYEDIKKINPDIKVLFLSGYPSEVLQNKGIRAESINLLTKPVSPTETLSKIREVLDM